MFLRVIGSCLAFLIFCNALLMQGEAKADVSLEGFETYVSKIAKTEVAGKELSARWQSSIYVHASFQNNSLLSNYLSKQLLAISHESNINFIVENKESSANLIIKSADQFEITKPNYSSSFHEKQCSYSLKIQNEVIQKAEILFKKDSTSHQIINCLARGLLYVMGLGDPQRNGFALFNSKLNPLSINLDLDKQDLFIIRYIYAASNEKKRLIKNFYQADTYLKTAIPFKTAIGILAEKPSVEKFNELSMQIGRGLSYNYIAANYLVWSSSISQFLLQDIAQNRIQLESLKNPNCYYCFFSFLVNYTEALSDNNGISEGHKTLNLLITSYDNVDDPIIKPAILYYKASLNMDQIYARDYLKEALDIAERYNGSGYPQVLNIRHRLAEWYLNKQEFAKAAQEISLNQKFYDGRYFSPVAEGQRFFDGALVFWKAGLHKEAKQNLIEARKRFIIGNYSEGIQKVNELEKLINL